VLSPSSNAKSCNRKFQDWHIKLSNKIDVASVSRSVQPITPDIFHMAKSISRNHQLRIFDAQIVAVALVSGATTLWSEDMQHGQVFEKRLTIKNPFA
jgi:predicted nucleic acid-binding protein